MSSAVETPSVWRHWLRVVVPTQLESSIQSGIFVGGGVNSATPPVSTSFETLFLAIKSKTVICQLGQIPNQPTVFTAEGRPRVEDAIIAYGWNQFFLNTSKPEWLPRLPMVKAVVRAMDAIQDFLPKINVLKPEKFFIGGASKRGWTTWLTPAVDNRVNAIFPMVMPIPNTEHVLNHLWRSLGLWTFVFNDYLEFNLTSHLNQPIFQKLAEIIDPASYMPYLAQIPKYIIVSTGDQFFQPDSSSNFYEGLQGPKSMRVAPNTDHSLRQASTQLIDNVANWMSYIKHGDPIPYVIQKLKQSNTTASITIFPSIPPSTVKLWVATTLSSTRRDFRLYICGSPECYQPVLWNESTLQANADGSYTASIDAPAKGWTGFLLEAQFPSPYAQNSWYSVTSEVVIVPDTYPVPSCGNTCGHNTTSTSQ
eukprot:TRINITY_DN12094_c0_g1_i1.p1 TRINITY_DN12094_c0_g1~~TRINITY_DN12094_c0_g1_i1.p1  ORF type:complete len:483 (+),score=103.72 TRINITY_DN12094_c0_g1_i1:185-1450(+)